MKNIEYVSCDRRTPRDSYYQSKFAKFNTDDIFVSERSPMSPRNGGVAAKLYWRRATEFEAERTFYPIWFKNASWYGAAEYYIKDRHEGGRPAPKTVFRDGEILYNR